MDRLKDIPETAEWMPLSEFARLVPEISGRTLRRWCIQGTIPASMLGAGRWCVNIKALRQSLVDQLHHNARQTAVEAGIWLAIDEEL